MRISKEAEDVTGDTSEYDDSKDVREMEEAPKKKFKLDVLEQNINALSEKSNTKQKLDMSEKKPRISGNLRVSKGYRVSTSQNRQEKSKLNVPKKNIDAPIDKLKIKQNPETSEEKLGVSGNPRISKDLRVSKQNTRMTEERSRISEQKPRISEQKPRILEQEPRISEEKSKLSEGPTIIEQVSKISEKTSKVFKQKPRIPAEKSKISEEKRMTLEQIQAISEEPTEIDTMHEELSADPQIETTKVDKAIETLDQDKSTQTKTYKRDRKRTREESKILEAKKSSRPSKVHSKEGEKRKKVKHRKICKHDTTKRDLKRRRCNCSEKSTLTEGEEFCPTKRRTKLKIVDRYIPKICVSTRRPKSKALSQFVPETCFQRREMEQFEPREELYPTRECECKHKTESYETDTNRSYIFESPCEIITDDSPQVMQEKFELPKVKKYLPMYQSPELIEELKRHDRMRLIQEKEAASRKLGSSFRSSDTSTYSRMENRRISQSTAPDCSFKVIEEDDRLRYQESQAYRRVLCELKKRARSQRRGRRPDESIPLICLSQRADTSRRVEQLYPTERRARKKPDVLRKFAHKIFKPTKYKRSKCKVHEEQTTFEPSGASHYDSSYDPEILTEISSPCKCIKMIHESEAWKSADTSDNDDVTYCQCKST
ncbi:zonadhesin-like [Ceratina calcarata]|uniref:Zonadhesin-like n=1 Tax=Ceratina calcarata TaxID=156304 RepID=A0AAJ7W8G2_9HYME|nr:zonadhesin-like [Ceratina calcarata]